MRNILVLPHGEEVHFQYPKDHTIEIGYEFQITLKDNSVVKRPVHRIVKDEKEPEIRYFL